MTSETAIIQSKIKEIGNLSKKKEYKKALALCANFISDHPDAWIGYRTKADIHYDIKEYDASLEAREKLAEIGSEEPSDYYDLARLCLMLGKNKECVKWADRGIQLCEQHQNPYYFQACHFYKANGLINTQRFSDALKSCEMLDDNYSTYISGIGMKTKEDLIRAAKSSI